MPISSSQLKLWSTLNGLPTTISGYGIVMTSSDVTTALGFTPYNGASNPNGYLTTSGNAATATTATTANAVNTSNNYQMNSLGVGVAASGTAGEITATGNVTGYYSDDRLKIRIGNIESALSKVLSLNGFEFISNETAALYGYTDKDLQVGVSAQEVKAVLPQAVVAAPFDTFTLEDGTPISRSGQNYLTVRYEKLVPLLIEAIKEQQLQIQELKQLLSH